MKSETGDQDQLTELLASLQKEVARLGERVASLEKKVYMPAPAPVPLPSAAEPEALSEELLLVIASAAAAYLGKKPHIRQIRLVSSAAWAQQGRVTVQASHALPVQHT
jgi:methylmalonyl-CoA carboxyltransferase large subunit